MAASVVLGGAAPSDPEPRLPGRPPRTGERLLADGGRLLENRRLPGGEPRPCGREDGGQGTVR